MNKNSKLIASFEFALFLHEDGTVWGWGDNSLGQVGLGQEVSTAKRPSQLPDLVDIVVIEAGQSHCAALTDNGDVWVWGNNQNGQLGLGDEKTRFSPHKIESLSNLNDIALGDKAILLARGKQVWGCGNNYTGILGNTSIAIDGKQLTPVELFQIPDLSILSASTYACLALKTDGTIVGWGHNDVGQLGQGTNIEWPLFMQGQQTIQEFYLQNVIEGAPLSIPLPLPITFLDSGDSHSLAVTEEHTVYGWGDNRDNQLGTLNDDVIILPTQIDGLVDIVKVSAGTIHNLALDKSGRVWAWGNNSYEQLNVPRNIQISEPVLVDIQNVVEIAAGYEFSLALKQDGSLWTWGRNIGGTRRDDEYILAPEEIVFGK